MDTTTDQGRDEMTTTATLNTATDYRYQFGSGPQTLTRGEYEAAAEQAAVTPANDADITGSWALADATYTAEEWAAFTREQRVVQVLGQARRRALDAAKKAAAEAVHRELVERARQMPATASGATCRHCSGPAADGSGDCGECR